MSQAQAEAQSDTHHHLIFGDGPGKPLIAAGAGYAIAAGIASLVLGLLSIAHMAGTILGVTAMLVGLAGQMVSVTRFERICLIFGVTVAFVGMGLGFAHGGFS